MKHIATTLSLIALLTACGGTVEEPPRPSLTIVGAGSLDFGTVLAGTSRALDVTLANQASDGPRIEPLENIAIGVNGTGLAAEHGCPTALAAGESCTIRVIAEPANAGTLAGTLMVVSNAKESPQTLPVSGIALAALNPATAAFAWGTGSSGAMGVVSVGKSNQRLVTIVNRGNAPGTVGVALADADEAWNLTRNTCRGATIQPDANCTATVTFTPTATGAQTAWLELSDPYQTGFAKPRLALTGTGI